MSEQNNNSNYQIRLPLILCIGLAAGVLIGASLNTSKPTGDIGEDMKKLREVLTLVEQEYVDEAKTAELVDDAIGHTSNDVLISTHSAIVLSDVFNNEIVMVQKTASGSTVRSVDEPTFGTAPSALMMTVFGADDSIGKRAQEFIEDKLRQATGTQAEIVDLEPLIDRMGSGFYRSELRTLLNAWQGGDA